MEAWGAELWLAKQAVATGYLLPGASKPASIGEATRHGPDKSPTVVNHELYYEPAIVLRVGNRFPFEESYIVSPASDTEEPVHPKTNMVAGLEQSCQESTLFELRKGLNGSCNEVTNTDHINRHSKDSEELIDAIGVTRRVTMESYNRRRAKRGEQPGIKL
jgi:hypothetical protein